MLSQVVLEANQLTSQRLISQYLSLKDGENVWTHEDVCISARRVANRCGVPPDAMTWRYVVERPDFGWSFAVRAVWRRDKLMPPLATHVVIESYSNVDEARLPDEDQTVLAINEWLCSL